MTTELPAVAKRMHFQSDMVRWQIIWTGQSFSWEQWLDSLNIIQLMLTSVPEGFEISYSGMTRRIHHCRSVGNYDTLSNKLDRIYIMIRQMTICVLFTSLWGTKYSSWCIGGRQRSGVWCWNYLSLKQNNERSHECTRNIWLKASIINQDVL